MDPIRVPESYLIKTFLNFIKFTLWGGLQKIKGKLCRKVFKNIQNIQMRRKLRDHLITKKLSFINEERGA